MFISQRKRANGTISISIIDHVKAGKRTVKKTVRTIGHAKSPEEIAILEESARALLFLLSPKDSLPRQPGPRSNSRYKAVPEGVELKNLYKYRDSPTTAFSTFSVKSTTASDWAS